jgi:hypothetical protein
MSSFSSSPFIPKEAEEEEIKGASEWFQLACAFRVGSSIPQQLSLGCFNTHTHTHTERTREKRRDSFLTYRQTTFFFYPSDFLCFVLSKNKTRPVGSESPTDPVVGPSGEKEICCVRFKSLTIYS